MSRNNGNTGEEAKPFIQVRDLRKTFILGRQKVRALAGISVDIPVNSFTVIMGPSGSGKSTLLYLLGGLDYSTSGTMCVNGQYIEKLDENSLAEYRRNTLGFIFQSFNLVSSLTALDNVAFPLRFSGVGASQRKKRATELLKMVGLEKRMGHKPTELSGGQQQRVAVARALINNPVLILADEPTGNLDTQSGLGIMQLLFDLHQSGRTVVVVSHDPRMLNYSTHSIFLLDGRIVSQEAYNQAVNVPLSTNLQSEENSSDSQTSSTSSSTEEAGPVKPKKENEEPKEKSTLTMKE